MSPSNDVGSPGRPVSPGGFGVESPSKKQRTGSAAGTLRDVTTGGSRPATPDQGTSKTNEERGTPPPSPAKFLGSPLLFGTPNKSTNGTRFSEGGNFKEVKFKTDGLGNNFVEKRVRLRYGFCSSKKGVVTDHFRTMANELHSERQLNNLLLSFGEQGLVIELGNIKYKLDVVQTMVSDDLTFQQERVEDDGSIDADTKKRVCADMFQRLVRRSLDQRIYFLPDLKRENVAFQTNKDGSVSVRIFDSCYHPDTVSDDEDYKNEFIPTAKSHLTTHCGVSDQAADDFIDSLDLENKRLHWETEDVAEFLKNNRSAVENFLDKLPEPKLNRIGKIPEKVTVDTLLKYISKEPSSHGDGNNPEGQSGSRSSGDLRSTRYDELVKTLENAADSCDGTSSVRGLSSFF